MLLTNSAEGVTPSGTTVTIGNSGGASGNAFDVVTLPSGGSIVSDSGQAAHGGLSYLITIGVTAAEAYLAWTTSIGTLGAAAPVYTRAYLYVTANPGTTFKLISVMTGTNATCGSVVLTTAGKIATINAAGTTIATSTNSVPLNAWCRVEFDCTPSATVGVLTARLYNTPDSATATETLNNTGQVLSAGPVDQVRFGPRGTAVASVSCRFDDVGITDAGPMGPSATLAAAGPVVLLAPGWQPGAGLPGLPGGTPFYAPPAGGLQASAPVVSATAEVASGTVAAPAPSTAVTAGGGVAASTATANPPVPAVTASAGVAAVSAAAPGAATATTATAGVAASAAVAAAAATTHTASSGVATATSVALAPATAITVSAAAAIINAAAPQPSVSTSGSVNANAGVAAVAASVAAGKTALTSSAGAAGVLSLSLAGAGNLSAAAPPAQVLAAAVPVPASFAVARSTPAVTAAFTSSSTVTDPRDGTATVTQAVTSTPGVSDPRDGIATVTMPDTSSPTVT